MENKRVLIGCEFSGTVRNAFSTLGWDAWSVDLLPSEIPGQHIQADITQFLASQEGQGWILGIFFPPCTYLANSGVQYLHSREGRWELMREGAEFFRTLLEAPIPHIAIENPIMHKYAREIIGQSQTQSIQPYEFGHPESKRTCLWLKNLPKLMPTEIVPPTWYNEKGQGRYDNQTVSGQNKLAPSADRWKIRSKTYAGIALAMASQWSTYMENLNNAK